MAEQVVATVVSPGTVIRGELRCAGDLVVHGRIEGAVSCGGALLLEAGGVIEAEVRARSAVLAGRVRGDVSVVEAAELSASCRLMGDLRAARVAIAPGAAVRGRVELGDVGSDDEAPWSFDDEAATATEVAAVATELAPVGAAANGDAAAGVAAPAMAPIGVSATDAAAEAAAATGPAPAAEHPSATEPAPAEHAAMEPAAAGATDAHVPTAVDAIPTEAFVRPPAPRTAPPPPPASALALGVRSTVVLKG